MSWSFSAIGKPKAVAAAAREAASKPYCREPEETFRKNTLETIALACETGFEENQVVKVVASGSQFTRDEKAAYNDLRLELSPVHGFLE